MGTGPARCRIGRGDELGNDLGRGSDPHVTVFYKSAHKAGTFSREDFSFDPTKDAANP
jgi:hypothetical protein